MGWTGGVYGVGKRMELPCTRKCVGAVLDGSMTEASFVNDPLFRLEIPTTGKGVPSESLNPRDAWSDKRHSTRPHTQAGEIVQGEVHAVYFTQEGLVTLWSDGGSGGVKLSVSSTACRE
ncbi:hypothetical protein PsorP6_018590 [Peronosclerospora sorghi]|nr:hypothetical protein PsorP6_018621 [Peronosclerospora sorghi]KAI9895241.1 hypothetical protein PsorP6_018590 [Peronosclerospora sorghi]